MNIITDDRPLPADCETMLDVRKGVDALDRALVLMLAERQRYMDAAARIKVDRHAVLDTARIEDVVTKVKAAAREAGLSEEIAEPVWRTLIDRCIAYEFGVWDQLRGVRND
ncbi:MAG: chorismate mutase [Pseudomonadota bacterium]|uniref:chorismate mutase n=1 Tax=Phenylobacterium sp. TaxID=1871053 RepID=UPI00271FD6EB|nr:chorismate mutase [Phenylobacterium sp.]MDO9430325.1 chorismate mutase [Phenylobacterium sp.]